MMQKIDHANSEHKKCGMAVLKLHKADFIIGRITKEKRDIS